MSAITALEFIVQRSEEAVHDGQQLEQWCRDRGRNLDLFPIILRQTYELPYRAEGFYDSLEVNGKKTSVMGCRQEIDLGPIDPEAAPVLVRDFVLREFMNRANWVKPDGGMGGFTIRKCFYKSADGVAGRFEISQSEGSIDWRQLGPEFDWVLQTMYLHDFVMDFGPYRKRFKESLGFVAHPSFVHVVENPDGEHVLEVTIGYPVAGYAPIPNCFGFGPGKFGVAVQYYTFLLTRQSEVKVHMIFAAAPRCEKVFDFGEHIPDPVYGGATLLHYLTFGLWQPDRFHDKIDAGMLAQHCRVHQSLIDGVGRVWKNWVAGAAQAPAKNMSEV
jgi:hypothetical protein